MAWQCLSSNFLVSTQALTLFQIPIPKILCFITTRHIDAAVTVKWLAGIFYSQAASNKNLTFLSAHHNFPFQGGFSLSAFSFSSSNTKPQIVKLHSTNLHPEANQRHLFCHSRYIYIYICLQEFWWFQRVNRQRILKPPKTLQSLSQSCIILRSAQHHLPTLPSTKSIHQAATEMGEKVNHCILYTHIN